jgi:hypothetical protein
LFQRILIIGERNTAEQLGNLQRLEKWQQMKFFPAAREEWTCALKIFAERHGLGPFLRLKAGEQTDLGDFKASVLVMLRLAGEVRGVLKNQAAVIHGAALEDDFEFFRELGNALRARKRAKADRTFLAFNILRYWFAGLLWLMNDSAGVRALRAYTGRSDITKDAYRKACRRLGLRGYKDRMKSPPVLKYDSLTAAYEYAPSWTWVEPNLSK